MRKMNRRLLSTAVIAALSMMEHGQILAASTCGSGGASTITSTETTQCAPASNETVTISNNGKIDTDIPAAIHVGNGIDGVAITNGGTISSYYGDAVFNAGTITELRNLAGATMISKYDGDEDPVPLPSNYTIHNAGHIGLIHNEGTIEHIDGGETILNSHGGTIDQIINDGTISSQRDGHSYDAITNFGTITNGIVNRGLIDGSVDLGDATLYLEGSSGRVTGGIYGNAAVVVNGTFTQENEIRTSHLEINSGGTLTLANHVDIASFFNDGKSLTAVVENKGRVIVNANTEAQIDNDYHQHAGATLEIGATSAAQYGRLRVTGDATFDADTGLHVNVSQVNTLANDNVLSGVVSAGGNLNATTFNVTDNSWLFDFEAAVNGNDIDLKTIATSNSGIHDSIASASFS